VKRTLRVRREIRFLCCVLLVAKCLPNPAQSRNGADHESVRVLSPRERLESAEISHGAQALSTLLVKTFGLTDDDGTV
jgi:hypothetical protein